MFHTYKSQRAFTLTEIMIVITIIGLLATMGVPAYIKSRQASQNTILMNDFRVLAGQLETFILEKGAYPEDAPAGTLPNGFEPYVKESIWDTGPSIGGEWDVENDPSGIICAIGVDGYTVPESQLRKFDQQYDDGSLSTGYCRKLGSGGYYFVVVE